MSRPCNTYDFQKIREMYDDGQSYSAISRSVGTTPTTIKNILIRMGKVTPRPPVMKQPTGNHMPKEKMPRYGYPWMTHETFWCIQHLYRECKYTVNTIAHIIKKPESDVHHIIDKYVIDKTSVPDKRCPVCNEELHGARRRNRTCGDPYCISQLQSLAMIEKRKKERVGK